MSDPSEGAHIPDTTPVPGALIDLSQPIANGMFHSRRYPGPAIRQVSSVEVDGMSVTHASFLAHSGTHVDAPSHFFPGGESITDISLDRFVGDGLVVSVDRRAREEITADDVAPRVEAFGPNAMVCLHTGWDTRYADAEAYRQYPYLSLELAHALVDLGVRMLALDTASPDMPEGPRPPNFDWPVHRVLIKGGVLITEQVAHLELVRARRFRLHALPIALAGSDGAPARVVAEVQER
jgi:kynurenine formamidase